MLRHPTSSHICPVSAGLSSSPFSSPPVPGLSPVLFLQLLLPFLPPSQPPLVLSNPSGPFLPSLPTSLLPPHSPLSPSSPHPPSPSVPPTPTSQPLSAPIPTPASCTLLPMPLISPHCPCPTPSPLSTNPKGTVAPFGAGGRVVVRVTSHPQHRSPPHPSAPRDEPRAWGAGSRPGASLTAPSPHLCSPTASLPSPPLLGGPCSSPFPRGPAARARPCPFSVSPPPRAPFPCPGPCSSAGAAR